MIKKYVTGVLLFGFLVVLLRLTVTAQGSSTPAERLQWVDITHKLEGNPLDENISRQAESALKAIGDAHDIHVPLCPAFLSEFNGMKYRHSHAITRQFMLASTAFMIENPGKADDRNALNLTAVESVLKAYTSILQQKPGDKAKGLEDLLNKLRQGELAEYVRKKCP